MGETASSTTVSAAHVIEPGDSPPNPSGAPSPEVRAGLVDLLRESNFRRLWCSQVCAGTGAALAGIAMPLLVYGFSGSARDVGVVLVAGILPAVILSPITGLMADRLNRRRLMMSADAVRLALVSLIPFTTAVWQMSVLAILIAVAGAVGRPAELAAVPLVAGEGRLVSAISLAQVTGGLIMVAMPAVGAGLVAAIGPRPVFWIQAACFAGSLVALRGLAIPQGTPGVVPRTGMNGLLRTASIDMWGGIRAIRQVPVVRGVTFADALVQVSFACAVVAGLEYTKDTARLGDRADVAFALTATAFFAGSVAGGLLVRRIEPRIGRPATLVVGYLGAFFLLSAAFRVAMPVIYATWFGFGVLYGFTIVAGQASLAEAVPDHERGRVYAAWGAIIGLAFATGSYGVGWLVQEIGAPTVFAIVALTVGIGAPYSLVRSGALRSLHHVPGGTPAA